MLWVMKNSGLTCNVFVRLLRSFKGFCHLNVLLMCVMQRKSVVESLSVCKSCILWPNQKLEILQIWTVPQFWADLLPLLVLVRQCLAEVYIRHRMQYLVHHKSENCFFFHQILIFSKSDFDPIHFFFWLSDHP